MPKDLINPTIEELTVYYRENELSDGAILDWLGENYGLEKQFWYGQRNLRQAVVVAMMNGVARCQQAENERQLNAERRKGTRR